MAWWSDGEWVPPGGLSYIEVTMRASDRVLERSHGWNQYAFPLPRPRRATVYGACGPR